MFIKSGTCKSVRFLVKSFYSDYFGIWLWSKKGRAYVAIIMAWKKFSIKSSLIPKLMDAGINGPFVLFTTKIC